MKKFLYALFAIGVIVACSKSDDGGGTDTPNTPNTPSQQQIYLSLDKTEFSVHPDGETCTAEVFTNGEWTAELVDSAAAEWCSITTTTIEGIPSNSHIITIFVAANETYDERSTSIKVKAGNKAVDINIYQWCKEMLTVSPTSFMIGAEGGQIQIEAGHNIDYDISISGKWIKQVETRAFVTDTLTFDIAPNAASNKAREGTITFTSHNGVFLHKVTIHQYGDRSFDPSIDDWESDGEDHGGSAE